MTVFCWRCCAAFCAPFVRLFLSCLNLILLWFLDHSSSVEFSFNSAHKQTCQPDALQFILFLKRCYAGLQHWHKVKCVPTLLSSFSSNDVSPYTSKEIRWHLSDVNSGFDIPPSKYLSYFRSAWRAPTTLSHPPWPFLNWTEVQKRSLVGNVVVTLLMFV